MGRDESGAKKPEQWWDFIPRFFLKPVLWLPAFSSSFLSPSCFLLVHALAVEVDEVLPKLRRNGEENQATDLQRGS